jgi:hypothetical protein
LSIGRRPLIGPIVSDQGAVGKWAVATKLHASLGKTAFQGSVLHDEDQFFTLEDKIAK